MSVIRECYPDKDRVHIYALPDLTNENDITVDWGRFVLDNVDRYLYKAPELMIYGNDEARSRWFAEEDIKDTSEFIVHRSKLPISATMLRQMMVEDNRKEWMQWVDPKLHKMYDTLRAELMAVPYYAELAKKG
jgi:nicotinamide-nucleotide adenylyltransferase